MDLDVEVLSRIQFALTIMFHYIFPPFSIGLGVLMVIMEGMYLRTGDPHYHLMTKFWTRIFAVNFALGVATGIVMEFQFGTNWARYAAFVGDVFGSALAAEGIFAFFLESGFLAVLVFGWDRVSKKMHFFATLMVALGSMFSAVWIVIANSWQHTPAGFEIQYDPIRRAVITDFWAMVFNPSSMHRLIHVLLGAFIQGSFFVMSISAYYILRRRHLEFARRSFTIALLFGTVSSLAIGVSGHFQGRAVAHNQPAKLAAFEGHFHTGKANLSLFGIPDEENERVDYNLAIPGGLSFLVHDDFEAPIPGLDQFPNTKPPVMIPFLTYHLMIGVGTGLMGLTLLALFFLWQGTLFEKRWLMAIFVIAVLGPILANQAGWVATEVGRQPYVVYPTVTWEGEARVTMAEEGEGRGLKTTEGLSHRDIVVASQVLGSIVMFSLVYLLLFFVWVYVLNSKIHHGPEPVGESAGGASAEGLLDAAGRLGHAGGYSLTTARQEDGVDQSADAQE